jgi:hypothetical protein
MQQIGGSGAPAFRAAPNLPDARAVPGGGRDGSRRPNGRRGGVEAAEVSLETPQPERRSLGDDRLLGPWRLMLERQMERAGVLVQPAPLPQARSGGFLACEAEVK